MKDQRQYVAVRGISFEGVKGKPEVKPGDPIPDSVPEATIKDLLEHGDIKEVNK